MAQRVKGGGRSGAEAPPVPYGTFVRYALIVLALAALAFALTEIGAVLILVAGAIIVATLVRLIADPLHARLKLDDRLAVAIAVVGLLSAVGAILFLFGREIAAQAERLFDELPRAIADVRERLRNMPGAQRLADFQPDGGIDAEAALGYARKAIGGLFSAVVSLLIAIVAGVMFAAAPGRYRDGLLLLFPKHGRARLRAALNAAGRALKSWLRGQFIGMAVVGVLTSVGLAVIGVPSWLMLGLIAALLDFVPLVGPTVAAIPGVLIAASMDANTLLWTLAVYIAVQQLESNVIVPTVTEKMASLPMALTLFAIVGFVALFGPMAAIVATPMAVALYVVVQMLYVEDTIGENIEVKGEKERLAPPSEVGST